MVLLPNATVTTSRRAGAALGGPVVTVLEQVPWRIWAPTEAGAVQALGGELVRRFQFLADRDADIEVGDVVEGWNPLNQTPAPKVTVTWITARDGPLPHLAGVLTAEGASARGT